MPCERLLYVMRHGLTNWNQSRRIQGHLDPPLNATGRAQARLTGLRLARVGAAALYSSDLQRASETARLVGRATGLQVIQDVGLREINFGVWQGLSSQEIRQRHPDVYAARRDNPYDVAPAGAETWRQFYARAVQAVDDILASTQVDSLGAGDAQRGLHGARIARPGARLHGQAHLRIPQLRHSHDHRRRRPLACRAVQRYVSSGFALLMDSQHGDVRSG